MSYTNKLLQLLKEKDDEKAVQLLLEAIEEEPSNPIHYVNLGTLLFEYKQFEQAEQFFLRALELDSKVATAHFGLANIYYEQENFDAAEKLLKTCIDLKLDDYDVFYLLGMTYVKRNNNMLAIPFLQRATELNEHVVPLFQYGLALANTNHILEAKSVFHRVLQLDEHHADTLYNLAIIHVHEDEFNKAKQLLQKSIKINPNHRLALTALEQINKVAE